MVRRSSADPTLNTVLTTHGGAYKGSGVAGTDPRTASPNPALNPFNAAGAFSFGSNTRLYVRPRSHARAAGGSDACPIDSPRQLQVP
jgi:hypothetical protein